MSFELVNMYHPDHQADRIAGALVDLAYKKDKNPKIAVEVLLGHGHCHIIAESSVRLFKKDVSKIVKRIVKEKVKLDLLVVPQDKELAKNQKERVRTGDNGIFLGRPITQEHFELVKLCNNLENKYKSDGKYIFDLSTNTYIVCQSKAKTEDLKKYLSGIGNVTVNPLGDWTGSINVDSGATNRKLGSDMGESVTGGGLHGKDISKADVSINIYCFLMAQKYKKEFSCYCPIGDTIISVNNALVEYETITKIAKKYIDAIGGFEKFAAQGLVRSYCNNIDKFAVKDILDELED